MRNVEFTTLPSESITILSGKRVVPIPWAMPPANLSHAAACMGLMIFPGVKGLDALENADLTGYAMHGDAKAMRLKSRGTR